MSKKQFEDFESDRQNDLSICMANSLKAASAIHIALAFTREEANRSHLLDGLHNVLIVAEQCRQGMLRKPSYD